MQIENLNNIIPSKDVLDLLKRTDIAFILIAGEQVTPFYNYDQCRMYAQGVSDTLKDRVAPIGIEEGIDYLMLKGYSLMIINSKLYNAEFNKYHHDDDDDCEDYI